MLSRTLHKALRHPTWGLGIVRAPISAFLDADFVPHVHWLPASDRYDFRADPFARVDRDGIWILYEQYDYRQRKGEIRGVRLTHQLDVVTQQLVFSRPFHLSYPYLLSVDGSTYCLPEMSEHGQLQLFQAISFPDQWSRPTTLLSDVAAVDASLFQYGDHWWLAGTRADHGPCEHLHLWYADDLHGPWQAHRDNPVKTDRGSARPAGTPFVHDGCLYRPGQAAQRTYGDGIVIHRVEELAPDRFREVAVRRLTGFGTGPYPHGIHTISAAGDYTLIDGRRDQFLPSELLHLVRGRLARSLGQRSHRSPTATRDRSSVPIPTELAT